MKTEKNVFKLMLLLCLLFSSLFINSFVEAQANPGIRMEHSTGEESGGSGGSSVQRTNRSLLEALQLLFSGASPSVNSNNPSEQPNGNTNGNSNGNSGPTTGETDNGNDGQTYTPPPNIESAGEVQFADNITKLIRDDCTNEGIGVVTKKNTVNSQMFLKKPSCITRASKPLTAAGTSELTNSTSAFYYLQCVACVRAMGQARGRPYNGRGDAKTHIGQKVSGYTYISNKTQNLDQLVPGSIGISNKGTYGHIFYITEVYKGVNGIPKAYKAFECNWGANGLVRHDTTRPIDNFLSGWQRPNSL